MTNHLLLKTIALEVPLYSQLYPTTERIYIYIRGKNNIVYLMDYCPIYLVDIHIRHL